MNVKLYPIRDIAFINSLIRSFSREEIGSIHDILCDTVFCETYQDIVTHYRGEYLEYGDDNVFFIRHITDSNMASYINSEINSVLCKYVVGRFCK